MAEYLSDQEQIEAIKTWLQKYGPGIVAGIVIGLAGLGGWRWWQQHQRQQEVMASGYYQAMLNAVGQDDIPKARGQAAVLTDQYGNTTYGVLAALMLAKFETDAGHNAKAAASLHWVLRHTKARDLRDIARLRLARILLAQHKPDQALAQLDQVVGDSFSAEKQILKGDIYAAQHKTDQARLAYANALNAIGPGGDAKFLHWKLNSLPAKGSQ